MKVLSGSTATTLVTACKGTSCMNWKEKEILRQRVNVGYVFQNFNLFPHLTVLENLIEAPIAHKS